MMKYFLVSSVLFLLASCAASSGAVRRNATGMQPSDARVWTEDLRSDDRKNSYQVKIRVQDKQITGICLLKKSEDGWRGTLINEFGAKAFDFVISQRKCELLNTISFMDKWYIRKTIAADLYFLFEIDNPDASFQKHTVRTVRYDQAHALVVDYGKKKSVTRSPDGILTMKNRTHSLFYSFEKMEE
ncbi:MAG: hypothetical protein LBT83_06745 [Tannerella sp.]|jgi:hypothetical protein|nr:hypothetical protein [Tannerella sp.]